MAIKTIYFICFCLFLTTACASLSGVKQEDLFETVSFSYEQAIFFGKYEAAHGFTKVEAPKEHVTDLKRFKMIKVTSYELIALKALEDRNIVTQRVEISYYFLDSLVEKTIVDNQLWKYYPEEKIWYLESGLPDFK
jgi:hypothetical protein